MSPAQVVYTDIDPDFSGGQDSFYVISFDDDGPFDIEFENEIHSSDPTKGYFTVRPVPGVKILGTLQSITAYPYALDSGDIIGPGDEDFIGSGYGHIMNSGGSTGSWIDVEDKYLGVEFYIDGNKHYGWVRLDVDDSEAVNYVIKDYAYESNPDWPILAGATESLSVDDSQLQSQVLVFSSQQMLYFINTNESDLNYEIFSINGQKVHTGKVKSGDTEVDISQLSRGMYLVKIFNQQHNFFVKKIAK